MEYPLIKARGTHKEVGRIIGEKCKVSIQNIVAELPADSPDPSISLQDLLEKSNHCLEISRKIYPQYVEEWEGIAEGAGVPFEHLFLSQCEELFESVIWKDKLEKDTGKGCTDLVARGPATVNGNIIVGHTNDLSKKWDNNIFLLQIKTENEPEILAISPGGVCISCGFNAAGISLTGNQVYNDDIRLGVPRLMVVRAILSSTRIGEAIEHCYNPHRASSYNNVIADRYGEAYSMEGSATAMEPIYIENDTLVHANHYVSELMKKHEAAKNDVVKSVPRYFRAKTLLKRNFGQISVDLMKKLLADHHNSPHSICKHGPTYTIFSIIVDIEKLEAWIGHGRSCSYNYKLYKLDPFPPQRPPNQDL